jgi:hypothetical protein
VSDTRMPHNVQLQTALIDGFADVLEKCGVSHSDPVQFWQATNALLAVASSIGLKLGYRVDADIERFAETCAEQIREAMAHMRTRGW